MPYNRSTFISGENYPAVSIKCGNLRLAFLAFDAVFIILSIVLVFTVAADSSNHMIAEKARIVSEFFENNSAGFIICLIIIMLLLLYFCFKREKITWNNGVYINDKQELIKSYQFKQFSDGNVIMYLRSTSRLWILYPVTSQDNQRFKDKKLVEKETKANHINIELLKSKLSESNVAETRFWFFSIDVIICLAIFALTAVIGLSV